MITRLLIVIGVVLVAIAADTPKLKSVTVTEVVTVSRDCPDDANGQHNYWYLSATEGEQVTLSCNYTEEESEGN